MATVESGASVSHYRVIGPLGAGGMGEVYKAQDMTLERTVALKILPPDLVRNEERVRRFMQEAKSASSLNHPNIVTIHEIGQFSVADQSLHFIAMELVDGYTLRRKIHEEHTDLRTLLQYLAQAADGLAKAHAAGIVHRDLKPENIMVTRDGFAKVLDFGLAKLSIKQSTPDATTEATEARQVTREGVVMGTVAYMSPEQVQGKVVDHRSDIFSFGCILYEAATRQRPFAADSDFELMHKIVSEKPQPVDEINPNVPAEVRRMVRRCLAKDPEKRYQSMKDIAIELAEIVDEFDELSVSTTSASSKSGIAPIRPANPAVWSLAAAVLIGVIVTGYFLWRRTRATPVSPVSYQSMTMQRLAAPAAGQPLAVCLSPDARYVAFTVKDADGKYSLWVRQIATGSDVQIVPPQKTNMPAFTFSPDGNYIYYIHIEQESGAGYAWLYLVPALGGAAKKLIFDVDTYPSFSPDGKQIAFGRGDLQKNLNYIVIANADGTGQPRILSSHKRLGPLVPPVWTADGKGLLTAIGDLTGGEHVIPIRIDVASGKEEPLGTSRWDWLGCLRVLPDGSGFIASATDKRSSHDQIWFVPLPTGKPSRVTNDLSDYGPISLSADGKSVVAMRFEPSAQLVTIDVPHGSVEKPLQNAAQTEMANSVFVAANGSIVSQIRDEAGGDVAMLEGPEHLPRFLTNDGRGYIPVMTGDGKTIIYASDRNGDLPHVFAIDADGSNSRQLTHGSGEGGSSISADGRVLLYSTVDEKLFRANGDGSGAVQVADKVRAAVISQDGTKIAYSYIKRIGDRDVPVITVIPTSGGKAFLDLPFPGSGELRWTKNSDGFSYIRVIGGKANIHLQKIDGSEARQVTNFSKGWIGGHDWTADGKLIVSHGETRSEMIVIRDFH